RCGKCPAPRRSYGITTGEPPRGCRPAKIFCGFRHFFRDTATPSRRPVSNSWGGSAGRTRTPMLTQRRFLLPTLSPTAVLASTQTARASSIELSATPFTGDQTSVRVSMNDAGGDIAVTLTVNEGVADLRGFFINIKDFSLLDGGLQVTGDDVTKFVLDQRGVI